MKDPASRKLRSLSLYLLDFLFKYRAIHKIPATAKIASNPGTGGAVEL